VRRPKPTQTATRKYAKQNREHGALIDRVLELARTNGMYEDDDATAITDLLADLRHWGDLHNHVIANLDDAALNHYQAEIQQALTGEEQA